MSVSMIDEKAFSHLRRVVVTLSKDPAPISLMSSFSSEDSL